MLLNSIKAYIGGELDLPQVQEELDIPASPENCAFRVDEDSRTVLPPLLKASHERKDIA